jgi:hypothetical protein
MRWSTRRRLWVPLVSAAAVVCAAAVADADDVDDGVKAVREAFAALKQNEYEEIFGARQAKLGQLPFRDQAYGVAQALAKEPGWEIPVKLYVFEPSTASGPVFWSTWSSGKKAEAQPSVTVVVTRYSHSDGKATVGGAEVAGSDALALVGALSAAWAAGLEQTAPSAEGDPAPVDDAAKQAATDREACVAAVKKAVGVGTAFAALQGRVAATKKRERREWFAWTGADASWVDNGGKATWVACVRYDESVLSKTNPAMSKGAYFMGKVHVYKGVAAK